MNELSSQVARAVAAGCMALACLVSILAGAGLTAVLLRSAVAYFLSWILAEFLVRRIFHALLLRVMEARKPGRIDITLN